MYTYRIQSWSSMQNWTPSINILEIKINQCIQEIVRRQGMIRGKFGRAPCYIEAWWLQWRLGCAVELWCLTWLHWLSRLLQAHRNLCCLCLLLENVRMHRLHRWSLGYSVSIVHCLTCRWERRRRFLQEKSSFRMGYVPSVSLVVSKNWRNFLWGLLVARNIVTVVGEGVF